MELVETLLRCVSVMVEEFSMHESFQLRDLLLLRFAWTCWDKIKRRYSPNEFDMPIRDAILHVLSTEPHSYESQLLAERTAFKEIHKLICTGKLAVVGVDSDFKPPMRIKPKECRQLFPHEVVVPRSETAPNGYVFALIDRRDGDEHPVRYYRALRVRSKQFYKHWPKVKVNGAAKR